MKMQFVKNLRFRLSILYSVIFFVFSGLIILTFNVYINIYAATASKKEFHPGPPPVPLENEVLVEENQEFYEKELERMIHEASFERLKSFQKLSVVMLFVLALVSFVLGYFVSGFFLYPLKELSKKIKKLKTENLGIQIEKQYNDEIGQLVDSFNVMSKRLKDAFEAQGEFVQNAAHELKTPLTIIQTNLDTITHRKNVSLDDYKKAIERSLLGMEKMNKLTENLLTLAAPVNEDFKDVDVESLVKEQFESLKKKAGDEGVKIDLLLTGKKLFVKGDKFSLGRAIYNLIENAIKFSSVDDKPKVKISVKDLDDKVKIKISNNGQVIDKEERAKVFERFYRVDKSRNSNNGGYGLGLAIVRKIIDAHSGKIYLDNDEKLTNFVVEIKKI